MRPSLGWNRSSDVTNRAIASILVSVKIREPIRPSGQQRYRERMCACASVCISWCAAQCDWFKVTQIALFVYACLCTQNHNKKTVNRTKSLMEIFYMVGRTRRRESSPRSPLTTRPYDYNKLFTHFSSTVSTNKCEPWHSRATNNRWDICNVGLSSTASVCAFILFDFSYWITASKWRVSHASSVWLAPGNWLHSAVSSSCCCVTWAIEAASSNRGNKSVVRIGSGSSLKWRPTNNGERQFC